MTDREQQWAAYRAWNKDFKGPIYFFNWDQWIKEYGFAVWQASRRAALEEAAKAALNDSLDAIWADGRLMDPREVGSACADAIRALSQKDPQ